MGWFSSAFDFLVRGGPVMLPLMVCSLVSVTVIVERWLTIRAALKDSRELTEKVGECLAKGQTQEAASLCASESGPVAAMLGAGVANRHLGVKGAERAMVDQATRETYELTARLWFLDTIITIAPLLGLLGTVTGMIRSFHVISSREGISTPTAITGGVAEALIATATGLAVAIVSLIFYNALNEKVKQVTASMESAGTYLLNVLSDDGEEGSERNEVKLLSA
jgi:biopolymer transport protein ExbB